MKERGILFSAPMVRAILDGTKTQTRRAVKFRREPTPYPGLERAWSAEVHGQQVWVNSQTHHPQHISKHSPYGVPGDRLWVRETWALDPNEPAESRAVLFRATDPGWDDSGSGLKWRPSIFMPRWASRITLEITEVRVQRLHDISEADIRAEGVTAEAVRALVGRDYITERVNEAFEQVVHIVDMSPRDLWRVGWSAINGAASWDANPWLWCLTFRRVQR